MARSRPGAEDEYRRTHSPFPIAVEQDVRPSDLQHLDVPSDPDLHPDGRRVAYVLSRTDVEDDRYDRTIHVADGGRSVRFTQGPTDTSPRWSPDGAWLAFLRKGADKGARAQLMVMPADGGEPRQRTEVPLGVSAIEWAPDSTRLVFVGAEWTPDLADLDEDERKRVPKRVTRLPYRSDGTGWIANRRTHLWVVDVDGDGEPQRLTHADEDHWGPSWHPDGQAIAYLTRPEDRDESTPQVVPMILDLDAELARPLTAPGMWASVDHAPDGQVLLTGLRDPFDWPAPQQIWRLDGDTPVSLTRHLDRSVLPNAPGCATTGPRFVKDGFLTALEDRGTVRVIRVEDDGGHEPTVTDVVSGERCVTGYAVRQDGTALAMTLTTPDSPGELCWIEGGEERPLTDLTARFTDKVTVYPTERFTFERYGMDLDVWAVLPEGFADAEDRSVPILFNIHGGPTSQYGDFFFDEFQVGAGAGYLTIGSNPRGSSGRGEGFCRAVVGAWGEEGSVDTLDLEAVVDAALLRYPQADPRRVAIMGGSYGGYATGRLLARSDRFGSAIVERGLLNWESFSGTSDIGQYFDRMFLDASLPDGAETHRLASPVNTAHRVVTPTLVLHSDADWRCPPEQGEQFFAALKRAGTPTEMVRFPDEGHELTRSGTPKHRVERFEIVLEWHERWLGHFEDAPGSGDHR